MKMNAHDHISNTRDYLNYLEEHINNVERAYGEFVKKCGDIINNDILLRMLETEVTNHDLTKFSEKEFVQYRKRFYPVENEYSSNIGDAIKYHLEHNLHHHQTWTKRKFNDVDEWKVHCSHMIIDWMAMGYKFNDTPRSYYENNKKTIDLPENAIKFMYEVFEKLEK